MENVSILLNKILIGNPVRKVLLEVKEFNAAEKYPYDAKQMKVSRKTYDRLIKDWQDDLNDSETEEDIAYHNEFYLRQLYKQKYLPF